jgi:hypothetical protein
MKHLGSYKHAGAFFPEDTLLKMVTAGLKLNHFASFSQELNKLMVIHLVLDAFKLIQNS